MAAAVHIYLSFFISLIISIIINGGFTQSKPFYIKEGEVPSFLYKKFEAVPEEIFPSFITIQVAFSSLVGTLLYSIDKNRNQLILTMRDDLHADTRYGVKLELNTQLVIVSLSKLCGTEGHSFDDRGVIVLHVLIGDKISLMCNTGDPVTFLNEKRNRLDINYPNPYSSSDSESMATNEAHLWLVNHPLLGEIYPNQKQMHGCILNVFYHGQSIDFQNVSSNVGHTCKVACRDDMCNGGKCSMIYSEKPICNCTKTFLNGRLCNDSAERMNFKTQSQKFVFKMFKLSWKSSATRLLELINRDIRILIGHKHSHLFFEYNFMTNSSKVNQVTLSNAYSADTESICIVYFHETMINIRSYTNNKWNSIWIESIFDMRQAEIDTLILTSESGTMDFVHKNSPEDLWTAVDIIKKIPVNYTEIKVYKVIAGTLSGLFAFVLLLLILLSCKKYVKIPKKGSIDVQSIFKS